MPLLFVGSTPEQPKRRVYSSGMRLVETEVFKGWKRFKGLAPYSQTHAVANIWHFVHKNHTAISWHVREHGDREQTVFIPQLLDQRQSLELARTEFELVIPGPTIFRFNQDYDEVLLYD